MAKEVQCPCGWSVTAESDEELITKVQEHAKQVHDQSPSKEEILALAKPA